MEKVPVKKNIILGLLFFIFLYNLSASEAGIQVSIRFHDKKIYYQNSQIFIKIEITNNSAETYRFKVADLRVFNLDFQVKTLTNLQLAPSEEFIIQRNTNQPIFFREMSLEPGEQYSFIEEMTRYIRLTEPGVYVIKALYYPELFSPRRTLSMESNTLTLSVRPGLALLQRADQIDQETGEILKLQPLSPDQVVEYTLQARQKSQWNRFFLYLDLERMMLRNPEISRTYSRLTAEEKERALARYKTSLMQESADEVILLIPREFEIIKTVYTADEGTVQTIQRYSYPGFTEIKRFTYYLYRHDLVWYIYNYEVRNLGTE